jgi:predicted transcriptional regulator
MNEQTVAVEIPQLLYRRLERLAQVTHQPISDLVAQAIDQNLPPLLENLSPEIQEILVGMELMSDDGLWQLARSQISSEIQNRYEDLLDKERSGSLSKLEKEEFEDLYNTLNSHMLRKAYACALLKWRGYALPSPSELNLSR